MSDISVDDIKSRSGSSPDLPSGANISGVSTAATIEVTNLNPTHINASGVTTATTFSGSFKSTSTPTLGLGVTINASGINISGVCTAGIVSATTLYGDASNLTGVAFSISPISYNPDPSAVDVPIAQGIGLTFNDRIKAGSGNVTLRISGAAGTVVENFGVGSSVSYNNTTIAITPTDSLASDTVYHLSYPSGAFTNEGGDVSYVGTAYTFDSKTIVNEVWVVGKQDDYGQLGQNNIINYSSPVQVPGSTWNRLVNTWGRGNTAAVIKSDGTLWVWGRGNYGGLGDNAAVHKSSPVQVPGTTWANASASQANMIATKTDGTLWAWGKNEYGQLGLNNRTYYSSPVQIPGTSWSTSLGGLSSSHTTNHALRTDGTLWSWGDNEAGELGNNNKTKYSSPVQIPGTSWSKLIMGGHTSMGAIRTDGTLWLWGQGEYGQLGNNEDGPSGYRSSPIQVPGTTWANAAMDYGATTGTKTDGTLWSWGYNTNGGLGQNDRVFRSSPVQIPGTTWNTEEFSSPDGGYALKTDGTLWVWGDNSGGQKAQNNTTQYSSPVQVPGTDWNQLRSMQSSFIAIKQV